MKQKQILLPLGLAVAFIAAGSAFAPASVYAKQEKSNKDKQTEIREKVNQRKSEAKEKVEERRQTVKQQSKESRKDVCGKNKDKLTRSMSKVSEQATRHMETFDSIYERVQGFYESGKLTTADYDQLDQAATDAQSQAYAEIMSLEELAGEVDCDNPDVAASVTAFKDAAGGAKESLKQYRRSLVDLISSLKSAADEQAEDESDQDSGVPIDETNDESDDQEQDSAATTDDAESTETNEGNL